MKYAVVIERGPTSYGAHVPDLPGCVAAAETKAEVCELIREAVAGAQHGRGRRQDPRVRPVDHRRERHGEHRGRARLRRGCQRAALHPVHVLAGRTVQVLHPPRPAARHVLDAEQPGHQLAGPRRVGRPHAADEVHRRAGATSGAGSSCTTASTASTGSPRAAWRAGRTASTAASCIPARPSTGTIS